MSPDTLTVYQSNQLARDAEAHGNLFLGGRPLEGGDFPDCLLGEDGTAVTFPDRAPFLGCHVALILRSSAEPQVVDVDAARVVTARAVVKYAQPVRYRTVGEFPCNAMSEYRPAAGGVPDLPIAESGSAVAPQVAGFRASTAIHLGLESFCEGPMLSRHQTSPSM